MQDFARHRRSLPSLFQPLCGALMGIDDLPDAHREDVRVADAEAAEGQIVG
jgi:hypothetical protein